MREKEERDRPWRQDKRSWILYLDQLKEIDGIISDRVDGNIYMFDCGTARLSVWSEQWQAFADVGISRFLKQERENKSGREIKNFRETEIFYKGIRVQKIDNEVDTELIEYIDIKRELSPYLLNLSRGSFTIEGKHYLTTELYPGLLDGIHKVLIHLETRSYEGKNFVEKVEKNLEKRCIDLERDISKKEKSKECELRKREFIDYIVSLSMLSCFACRDEWELTELLGSKRQENGWKWLQIMDKINEKLNSEEMEKVRIELAEMTNFFNLTIYGESYKEAQERGIRTDGRRGGCFAEIFSSGKHWAIRQVRRDKYSGWKMQLVQLAPEHEELYQRLISFPKEDTEDEELEKWAKNLCKKSHMKDIQLDSSQQFIMRWLLKNIPTVGMFCGDHGNLRVNIFSARIYPSIYLNRAFKRLIVERMCEHAGQNIQRFSTITWQGREDLSFKELPFNLFFVKRGYLSRSSYRKCIVPIQGEDIKQWKKFMDQEFWNMQDQFEDVLHALDIDKYLRTEKRKDLLRQNEYENVSGDVLVIEDEFHELILGYLETQRFDDNITLNELLDMHKEHDEEWKEIYDLVVKFHFSDRRGIQTDANLMKKIMQHPGIKSLCKAWIYLSVKKLTEVEEKWAECERNSSLSDECIGGEELSKEQKILDYIQEQGIYSRREETFREHLRDYRKELVNLMSENEMDSLRSTYEELFRKSKIYCIKIESTIAWIKREEEQKRGEKQEDERKTEVRRDE